MKGVDMWSSPRYGKQMLVMLTLVACFALLNVGQALATHVECGDTITEDTTLDSDLTNCHPYGVVIGADDITLDLGGHTIDGVLAGGDLGADGGIGIYNGGGYDDVTIQNGTVQGFTIGVVLVGATGNEVRDLSVLNSNGSGMSLLLSNDNLVENNTLSGNSFGVMLSLSNGNEIRRNSITDGPVGIAIVRSDDNLVERNVISASRFAVLLSTSTGNVIARNSFAQAGVGPGTQVAGNIVEKNRFR
jgi:parallel beta-helix repeat protein